MGSWEFVLRYDDHAASWLTEKVYETPPVTGPSRLPTTAGPEDVARCITALCHPAIYWMTGNTLDVDGGENVVG
jgi:NAD(P)-dependent dehydrogenase (short-subunit alcohol dehydrogenase family)